MHDVRVSESVLLSQSGKVEPPVQEEPSWGPETWFLWCQLRPFSSPSLGLSLSSANERLVCDSIIIGKVRFGWAKRKWSYRKCQAFEVLYGSEYSKLSRKMGMKTEKLRFGVFTVTAISWHTFRNKVNKLTWFLVNSLTAPAIAKSLGAG